MTKFFNGKTHLDRPGLDLVRASREKVLELKGLIACVDNLKLDYFILF